MPQSRFALTFSLFLPNIKLPSRFKNFLLILVETLRLYDGLNHIVFLFLLLVSFVTVDRSFYCWNVISCLNSLSANAVLYTSLDLLNVVSSADRLLILLDTLLGRFLIMFGGWLETMLIYNGLLSGFLYGWYLPVFKFRVTSRKLTAFKFVSQVILTSKSSLKIFIKSLKGVN